MGKLDDIEKKIYRKDDRGKLDAERKHNTPYSVYGQKSNKSAHYEEYQEADPLFLSKQRKKIIRGAIFGLALLGLGGLVSLALYINAGRFSPERVDLVIEGPEEITAGEEVEYTVRYTNNNRTSLKNASLSITLPDNITNSSFQIFGDKRDSINNFDLPELKSQESGKVTFSGRVLGEIGTNHQIQASLSYVPGTVNSTFDKESQFRTTITDSPLVVDIESPLESVSGNILEYSITVNNRGRSELNNLQLNLEYPQNFAFTSASQEALNNDNNQFNIGRIRSQGSKELTVRGTLGGNPGDLGIIKAQIGPRQNDDFIVYSKTQNSTTISEPFVMINQSIQGNNVANPGDRLDYTIRIQNNTDVPIRNGKLEVDVSDNLFNQSGINSGNADFDGETLTWEANALPELEVFRPNESAQVTFSVPIISSLPVNNFSDVEFRTRTQALFTSNEIPTQLGVNRIIQGNEHEVKLASGLSGRRTYTHNEGPNPPEVDKTTTYTVTLSAQTLTNDISDISYSTQLQPNVSWGDNVNPNDNGNIEYQADTREITWTIDNIPANTGKLRPAYQTQFDIEVTPPPNKKGQDMSILESISYSGTDTFTGRSFQGNLSGIEVEISE